LTQVIVPALLTFKVLALTPEITCGVVQVTGIACISDVLLTCIGIVCFHSIGYGPGIDISVGFHHQISIV